MRIGMKRRLALMGAFTHSDFDKKHLRTLAQSHYLPESRLTSWKRAFQLHGVEGLLPDDWLALAASERATNAFLVPTMLSRVIAKPVNPTRISPTCWRNNRRAIRNS